MNMNFFKSIFLLMCLLPFSLIHAQETNQKTLKTFVLRITSKEPGFAVPFRSKYMVMSNKGSEVVEIQQVTPYVINVSAYFVGVMTDTEEYNPTIKFEMSEKTEQGENLLLSGIGHSIFAHDDANGMGFVVAK